MWASYRRHSIIRNMGNTISKVLAQIFLGTPAQVEIGLTNGLCMETQVVQELQVLTTWTGTILGLEVGRTALHDDALR